jgi:2-phosphoglycerate kinase
MIKDRNWTVLFIGGASGTGKSTFAYALARYYGVNVLEADDVHLAVKTVTSRELFPAVHYWSTGIDWKEIGAAGNVRWLTDVSREMAPVLKEIADRHVADKLPVIIEGDFIHPELVFSFKSPEVRFIFAQEPDAAQIIQNLQAREGGEAQRYRAEISVAYGEWIKDACIKHGINIINLRPWDTLVNRAIACL